MAWSESKRVNVGPVWFAICSIFHKIHYDDVIMSATASQTASLTIFYSTVYSGADERKHQSSASLAFVWGIHQWPVNYPHKGPVTRKLFPFDDVIMMHRISLRSLQVMSAPKLQQPIIWWIWIKISNLYGDRLWRGTVMTIRQTRTRVC